MPKQQADAKMAGQTEKIAQEAIEEACMVLPGIQALFGFQLIAAFNDRFRALSELEQRLHFAEKQAQISAATGTTGLVVSGLEGGNAFMASTIIGSTLYNAANENVGDVNDIIIDKDGTIRGVVVGVGGFLGIGEKDVLVPLDRIQVSRDESNKMKSTITASKEELDKAPAFDRTRWQNGNTTVQ